MLLSTESQHGRGWKGSRRSPSPAFPSRRCALHRRRAPVRVPACQEAQSPRTCPCCLQMQLCYLHFHRGVSCLTGAAYSALTANRASSAIGARRRVPIRAKRPWPPLPAPTAASASGPWAAHTAGRRSHGRGRGGCGGRDGRAAGRRWFACPLLCPAVLRRCRGAEPLPRQMGRWR